MLNSYLNTAQLYNKYATDIKRTEKIKMLAKRISNSLSTAYFKNCRCVLAHSRVREEWWTLCGDRLFIMPYVAKCHTWGRLRTVWVVQDRVTGRFTVWREELDFWFIDSSFLVSTHLVEGARQLPGPS